MASRIIDVDYYAGGDRKVVTSVDVYKSIRALQLEGVTSQRAAAKILGISRNTVKKYWMGDAVPWDRKAYQREASVITPEVNLDFAHYNPLFVYPGTPLYKEYFTNDISERKWVDYLLKDSWPWGEIVYENENLSREMILNLTEKAYERFYADSPYKDNEMVKDRFRLGISI